MIRLHFVPKSKKDKERVYEVREGTPLMESKIDWKFIDKDGLRWTFKKVVFNLIKE